MGRITSRLFASIDLAVFSGSNLLIGILVVKLNGLTEYGTYALSLSFISIFHSIMAAVLLEPATIFGAGPGGRKYIWAFEVLGSSITIAGLIPLALVEIFAQIKNYETLAIWIGIPGYFLGQAILHVRRRIYYLTHMPASAFLTSLKYSITILVIIGALAFYGILRTSTVFSAGMVAGFFMFFGWRRPKFKAKSLLLAIKQFQNTKRYMFWTFITIAPSTVALQGIYWMGYLLLGTAAVGIIKLFEQLTYPLLQLYRAFNQVEIVKYTNLYKERGVGALKQYGNRLAMFYLVIGSIYCAILACIASPAVRFLADDAPKETISQLYAFFLVVLMQGYSLTRNMLIKSLKKSEELFKAYSIMSLTLFIISFSAIPLGVWGLLLALFAGWGALLVYTSLFSIQLYSA